MASRSRSRTPVPDVEALILPDGTVSEETVDLLHEFVHPHHHQDETLVDEPTVAGDNELELRLSLPWWKRPSSLWILCAVPFSASAMAATIAPKVEIYTELACLVHKPEIFEDLGSVSSAMLGSVSAECAKDPVVAAAASKLIAVITTTTGVLTCLTTAWWGSFSDRHGRTTILTMSLVGLFCAELNFIIVTYYFDRLPGGYWFLLVGFIMEGLLGGMTAGAAAVNAYIADTTPPGTRSRSFSLVIGLMSIGFALGPTLGGLLITFTKSTISVFYLAATTHFIFAMLAWLVMPESLTRKQMLQSAIKYKTEFADGVRSNGRIKRVFRFLSPLAIFVPGVTDADVNPLKVTRDWNLLIIVLAYAFTISIMGSFPYKFQYAAATFSWGPDIMGYWLSIMGASRAIHLTLVLPLVIHLVKYFSNLSTSGSISEREPLVASSSANSESQRHKPAHSPRFDLNIARISLLIDVVAYAFMAVATRPLPFLGFGMMSALGAGFNPAIHAVALELYIRRHGTESGTLFGAMSVVQALSSQILGPAIYGLVYIETVSTMPQAIFFLSMASVSISFILLLFVRIRKSIPAVLVTAADEDIHAGHSAREATLVHNEPAGGRKIRI